MATADKIFISHASTDRKLADLLRDTLVLGGIPRNRIFYSSSRVTGIPAGSDVRAQLRNELQQAGLIIELISTTFLSRPMCLLELGGAWALEKPTYPIVVPPLTRSQVVAQIGDVNMGQLGSPEEVDDIFDELHDRLASETGLTTTAAEWNPVARRFKEGLPTVLAALAAAAAPKRRRLPHRPRLLHPGQCRRSRSATTTSCLADTALRCRVKQPTTTRLSTLPLSRPLSQRRMQYAGHLGTNRYRGDRLMWPEMLLPAFRVPVNW